MYHLLVETVETQETCPDGLFQPLGTDWCRKDLHSSDYVWVVTIFSTRSITVSVLVNRSLRTWSDVGDVI